MFLICRLVKNNIIFCRDAPPMIPTDTNQGYKQMKAKIGQSRVRPWKWMPFTNPARKVGYILGVSDLHVKHYG